jgi:ankyrin repeat protein
MPDCFYVGQHVRMLLTNRTLSRPCYLHKQRFCLLPPPSHPDHPLTRAPRNGKGQKVVAPLRISDEKTCDRVAQPIAILSTFMQAASTGNIRLVEFALSAGANISMVADDGSTALHCAAKTGQSR